MANAIRGEIESDLFGEPLVFCLTLGALAEIETHFHAESLAQLLARFSKGDLSSKDVLVILSAAARRQNDAKNISGFAHSPLNGGLERAVTLVSDLFAACFDPKYAVASGGTDEA